MTPPAPLPGETFDPDDDPSGYLGRRVRGQESERLRQTKALNDLIGQDAAGDPAAARTARALARARADRARREEQETGEGER